MNKPWSQTSYDEERFWFKGIDILFSTNMISVGVDIQRLKETIKQHSSWKTSINTHLTLVETAVKTGNLLYLSGVGPANKSDGTQYLGKVGSNLSIEEGYDAARLTGINLLARLKSELGDFDKVIRVVKLLGMVNSDSDFDQHPSIINGCSDLLVEVFGDKGRHARSAVGMSGLPNNIPVEMLEPEAAREVVLMPLEIIGCLLYTSPSPRD